ERCGSCTRYVLHPEFCRSQMSQLWEILMTKNEQRRRDYSLFQSTSVFPKLDVAVRRCLRLLRLSLTEDLYPSPNDLKLSFCFPTGRLLCLFSMATKRPHGILYIYAS